MSDSAREVRLIGGPRDGKTVFVADTPEGVVEVNDPNPPAGMERRWTYHVVDYERVREGSDPGEVWTAEFKGNHDAEGGAGFGTRVPGYDVDP